MMTANCRVALVRLTDPPGGAIVSTAGEDIVTPQKPVALPGTKDMRANLQPYSMSTDGGVFNQFPEMKQGIYYKLLLELNKDTQTIQQGDMLQIVYFPKQPHMVGWVLGIEKSLGRGIFTNHISAVARRDHRF